MIHLCLLLALLQVLVTTNGSPFHDHKRPDADGATLSLAESYPAVSDLQSPESSEGLRRTKRKLVIPPIKILENDRGPFPKLIVQIKSSLAKEAKMVYSISGEGADQDPKGLFTINRNDGSLHVTRALDREAKDKYVLQVHAVSTDGENREEPMEIIVEVIDMSDNMPIFTQEPFNGSVPEASAVGLEFMTVTATDADDPSPDNANVRYSILSQNPQEPDPAMFVINPVTGAIRVNAAGLDREKYPEYTLKVAATGMQGEGRVGTGTAVITVTDRNDHAPQFEQTSYSVPVPENKVGAVVVKLPVTDGDKPQSPAWTAKFRIVNDSSGGFFNVSTGPNKQEGIITTAKPLDFEQNSQYTLVVVVENDVVFGKPLPTSTATVTVNVLDVDDAAVNEERPAPVIPSRDLTLKKQQRQRLYSVSVPENTVGAVVVKMPVTDGDEAQSPAWTAKFRIIKGNGGGCFAVNAGPNKQEGIIATVKPLDFEQNSKFTLLVAVENDIPFAKPLTTRSEDSESDVSCRFWSCWLAEC
ncbi:hypothetical protein AOLI_G00283520 [Acnodon oligacanthus]